MCSSNCKKMIEILRKYKWTFLNPSNKLLRFRLRIHLVKLNPKLANFQKLKNILNNPNRKKINLSMIDHKKYSKNKKMLLKLKVRSLKRLNLNSNSFLSMKINHKIASIKSFHRYNHLKLNNKFPFVYLILLEKKRLRNLLTIFLYRCKKIKSFYQRLRSFIRAWETKKSLEKKLTRFVNMFKKVKDKR